MSCRSCTLIIPTYNRAELLEVALGSVDALRLPDGWAVDLVVVDNGSSDRTPEVVEEYRTSAVVPARRVEEGNQGLNYARNRGLLSSSAEWVVFLDDDMIVDPGWLVCFAEAVHAHEPDAVTGRVEPWFEEDPPEWLTPAVLRSVTSAYSLKGDQAHPMEGRMAHELPGCNFAVKRALGLELGGFHPALDRSGQGMLAGGDFEFGHKLAQSGASIYYVPGCSIQHFISRKKMSMEGLRQRWYGLGATSRAISELNGAGPDLRRRAKALIGIGRQYGASLLYGALGQEAKAVERRLQGYRSAGFLWGAPRLTRREWPPKPLA